MKKLFFLFALTMLGFIGKAQITITANDFAPALQLGETVTSYMDRTTTTVDVGTQGLSSWDFSALVADYEFITESKDVSSSPYASDFNGAEFTSNYSGIFEGTFSNTWVYNTVADDFLTHGTGTVANTSAGDTKTIIKYDPVWVQYHLPMNYGDQNSYSGIQNITNIVTVPGFGEFPTTISQTVSVEQSIDAYGVMTMPDGKRLNALRIVETTTFNNNGTITTSVVIKFLSNSGEIVSVTPKNQNETSGTIQVSAGSISWTSGRGESLPENTVTAPSGLTATATETGIELNWSDNSDNETGFTIERIESNLKSFEILATLEANTTSYTDETATPGTDYTYRITAFNNDYTSGYSNEANATVPEPVYIATPTDLEATGTELYIHLNWTDNADNESGYQIERKIDGDVFGEIYTLEANTTSFNDYTAEAGFVYVYRVRGFNADAFSEYSNTASAHIEMMVVTAPSELIATAGANSIDLSWTDNADNETLCLVERKTDGGDFSVIAVLDANSSTFSDATAEAGVTYIYRVKAVNEHVESEYSNTASAQIEIVLATVAAPSELVATASESTIELTWIDNADNESQYKVERKIDGGEYAVIAEQEANTISFSDDTAEPGVTYIYRVKALNSESESEYSNTASAQIEIVVATVAAPSELMATALESTIELTWTDNADNESQYKIERKTDGGEYAVIAELEANIASFSDDTAEPGVTYIYRVKALNGETESDYSNTASAQIEIVVATVAAPSELVATAAESTIELNWTDNADNESQFKVERKTDGGEYAVIAELEANITSFSDDTAEPGVTYIFRVKALNDETESEYSNTASASIETTGIFSPKTATIVSSNYPNPFKDYTAIEYFLNKTMSVTVYVLDIRGQIIETLVQEVQEAGRQEVELKAGHLNAGIYFYRIQTPESTITRKMMMIK